MGRDCEYLKAGLAWLGTEPEWFDGGTSSPSSRRSTPSERDSESPALRVAMFASWLRWCGV